MNNRIITLKNKPKILSFAAVAGKKEAQGPLFNLFDAVYEDTKMGADSWEKAESLLQKNAIKTALKKGNLRQEDVDVIFAGDLLNQCTGSSFGIKDFGIPFAGVYGACSTMALSLCMAAMSVDSGYCNTAVAATSSHFCSAEKQFRKPLEYGGQRPPSAQWTVTGAGSAVVSKTAHQSAPKIEKIAIGKICDLGITDANNMGAAMAPVDVKLTPYPTRYALNLYTKISRERRWSNIYEYLRLLSFENMNRGVPNIVSYLLR